MLAAGVQDCDVIFIVPVVEIAPNVYIISYAYVRYLCIISGHKYEFGFPYIPIFGLIKIFYSTMCVYPDFDYFHPESVFNCLMN